MRFFDRQTVAALRVYSASWLNLVVLAIYVVGVSLSALMKSQTVETRHSVGFANAWNVTPWSQLPSDPSEVTSLSISSSGLPNDAPSELDVALRPGSPFRVPGGMPKLKHLVVYALLTESQLMSLLENRQLESLSVVYLEEMSPAGWNALARQPLKSLDILSASETFWKDAKFPKTLETLFARMMDSKRPPDDQTHLTPLLGLTRLRTLQLSLWEREGLGLRAADRDVISQLPSLRRFYVNTYWPLGAVRVQSELPGVSVRPSTYELGRVSKCLILMILMMLPLGLILHVLSLQFVTPVSRLVPGFNSPHFRAAGALILALILVQSLGLICSRCNVLSAVSLAVAACIPVYLFSYVLSLSGNFPGYINVVLSGPLIVISAGMIGLVTAIVPAEFDWLLQGQRPELTVVLLVLGLLAAVGQARILMQLSRSLAEGSSGVVPIDASWDLKGFQRWQIEGRASAKESLGWGRGQRQRLERAISSSYRSSQHQTLLWRASQTFTAFEWVVFFSFVMSCMGFVGLCLPRHESKDVIRNALLSQLIIMSTLAPFLVLQLQRPFLARHLLMTMSRGEWVRLIFRETARNFLPAAVLAVIGLVVLHYWNLKELWPTWHLVILCAACLMLLFALELIMTTYPAWVQFLACGISVLVFVFGAVYVSVIVKSESADKVFGLFARPAVCWCLVLVLAGLALRFAYYRWMNWELDKISG